MTGGSSVLEALLLIIPISTVGEMADDGAILLDEGETVSSNPLTGALFAGFFLILALIVEDGGLEDTFCRSDKTMRSIEWICTS